MPKTIQLRNVPDRLHREMVRRAKQEGVSLSEYLRQIVIELAACPTMDEIRESRTCLPAALSDDASILRGKRKRRLPQKIDQSHRSPVK